MSSPTQRSLERCRKLGYRAAVTEKWIPHTKQRKDLFGFIDILAIDQASGATYAIQACSRTDSAKRRDKIEVECGAALADVLRAGWIVEVWSWAKCGPRGKRKLWTLKRERLAGPNNWTDVTESIITVPENEIPY